MQIKCTTILLFSFAWLLHKQNQIHLNKAQTQTLTFQNTTHAQLMTSLINASYTMLQFTIMINMV